MKQRILKLGILFIIIILLNMVQEVYALENPGDAERHFKQSYGELYDDVYKKADLKSYYTFLGQMQGDSKVAFNASDYTTVQEIYCVNYGKDYPYQAQRDAENAKTTLDNTKAAYDKAVSDGQPSGMPSTAYNELLKNKKIDWYVADANYQIANNMSQSIMYKMTYDKKIDTSTETDSEKNAVAYALSHEARKGKRKYNSVQEYIDDEEGARDEHQRTIWSCFGYGSFTTEESVTAKAYAKDIAILNEGTKTIKVKGKIKGSEVVSDNFSSPINFSADYLTPKIITSGASLNDPADFANIDKDTQMSVKINAVQGKKEYEIEIEVDYETYIVSYFYYEQGVMYKDKSRSELQDLLKITGSEKKSQKCKIKIIITVDDTSIDITVNKVWNGTFSDGKVPTMIFQLYANGKKVTKDIKGNTIKNPIPTKTTYTWKNLPKEDENGNDIEYTIKEFLNTTKAQSNEEFKDGTYNKQKIKFVSNSGGIKGESGTITITNEVEGTPGKLIIIKKWSGSGLPDSKLPSITVNVTGPNGYNETFTLNSSNGWKVEIDNLEDGDYTVTEDTTGTSEITYNGKKYTITYNPGPYTAKVGGTVTITNSYEGEDEPEPEPGEGDAEIKKTVVKVLSKYEGDTSGTDIQGEDLAKVQRGDEVIFKIEVSASKDKKTDDPVSASPDEIKEAGYESDKDYNPDPTLTKVERNKYCTTIFCNNTNGYYHIGCIRDGGTHCKGTTQYHDVTTYIGTKVTYTDCKVTKTHKYRAESFTVTDELLGGNSKLTIKGLFSTSSSKYASAAGVSGLESEGWTQDGDKYIWKADESEINTWINDTNPSEDKPKTTATFYIICDVNEDWTEYGDEETNKATLTEVKFAEKIEKEIKAKKTTDTGKKTTYSCSIHPNTGWSKTGSKVENVSKDLKPEKGEGETINPNKSDTAKAQLQGYEAKIEKTLEKVNAQIHKANPTGDSGENTKVEWGDLLEYKITVTNTGGNWNTNFYEGLYVNDYFDENELKYVGDPDGDNYYHDAYEDGITKKHWNDGQISSWKTSGGGSGINYYKDDENYKLGTKLGDGLNCGDSREENISTVVVSKPGESVTNNADLIAIKNRNAVEIEMDVDPAEITNEVREYKAGVDKYVSEVTSKGLTCTDNKTNEVAEKYPLDDRKEQEDSTKESNPAMADRGDKIKFTITFKNKSDEANIWKFKLTDEFDEQLEYLDEFDSEATGKWTVNKDGNKLSIIYVGNDSEPGQNLSNDSEWEKIEHDQEVSINLYFQVVDGAEFDKKDEVYKNKVNIEQVWNRNSKHLAKEYITLDKEESSDFVKVRQISASIDKYVSGLFGGIEADVSSTIVNASRARKEQTISAYNMSEGEKSDNPVEVERGDEITYTIVVKNTQPLDNSGGLISAMKITDKYAEGLKFSRIASGPVDLKNNDLGNRKLELEYTGGHLLPDESFEFKLVFIMEAQDESSWYERKYENKVEITELKNVNDWTWSRDGAMNSHHDSCSYSGPCSLSSLKNEGGITSDLPSSDYVYMLAYAVELEKYVVNVQHTNDDGSIENYNKGNEWAGNGDGTDRETWNGYDIDSKTIKKETYPVQVEKGDIVTYEIKVKNTYNIHNGAEISWTVLQPSIYKIDIEDVFNSEDNSTIGKNDVGLEFIEAKADKGGNVNVTNLNNSAYKFEFTPQQCQNRGKNTYGYGIGSGEEATFKITVKVTRSNMYLYELINRATIQDIYNRNNTIGSYEYSSPEKREKVEYKVTNGNRLYKDFRGDINKQIWIKDPNGDLYATSKYISDADYINLKDLIISGYVWDDTDPDNKEDGLMTSTDTEVEGEVWAYLYRVEPISEGKYPEESTLVMKTKIDKNGYYIFGTPNETTEEINTKVYSKENNNKVTVNQKYRFEPTTYKTPKIRVNDTETKDTQTKKIYENNFTNYRIVKAPNKDYNEGENQDGSTTRYDINKYHGYYQYYVEFEYNGMKYTHTVYGSNSVLDGAKGNAGNTSNQDGQYNLITSGRATRTSENWLPYRTSTKDNSEYYEIDSNAAEFKSVRESFNNQFETVAVDKGIDPYGNETEVEYEKTGHTSQYKYNDNVKIRARSFITNWINIDNNITPRIIDNSKTYRNDLYRTFSATVGNSTNTLFFWDNNNNTRTYTNTVGTTEETEYLKYINLGLKQRPTLDLELTKDVYNVQVDINEKTMVYEYNCGIPTDRANNMDKDEAYYTTGYKLYLYKSDYYYRYTDYSNAVVQDYKKGIEPENSELNPNVINAENEKEWLSKLGFDLDEEKSESELNIQITYKYTITNKSGMPVENRNELIIGSINEIVDYHNADLIPNQTGRFVKNVNIPNVGNDEKKQYNTASNKEETQSGTVKVSTVYGYKNGNENGYKTINGNTFEDNKVKEYECKYKYEDKEKIEKFHTVYLSGMDDVKLYPKDSLDIYLTFTVSRNGAIDNDIGKVISLATKYNIAEISAFSSWYNDKFTTEWSKNLKTPGLVDKDSNPGNEVIYDEKDENNNIMNASKYEDDTYRVDITPELYKGPNGNKGERLIDGLVWEDVKYNYKGVYDSQVAKTINETMQVVSDGIYKGTRIKTVEGSSEELPVDKDQLIGNVKVELIEMIPIKDAEGNVIKVYEDRATVKKEIEKEGEKESISQVATKTSNEGNNKGRYELYGYIPGNYVVRFTYGDDCETIDSGYNGQDYKSTTYQVNKEESLNNKYSNVTYDANKTEGYITNIWHDLLSSKINGMEITGEKEYDENNNPVQKVIEHVSDARDDEVRRLEVSAYSRTINNKVAEVLNSATNLSKNESDKVIKALHKELGTNTWMFADTAKLQVEIEHLIKVDGYKKQSIDMSKLDAKGIQKLKSYRIVEQASRRNSITDKITNKKHSYYIGNIDFGLEARPTTNISLTKLVSGIRVETADGEEILDVEYEPQYSENGTLLLNDNGVPTVDNTVTTGAEHMQALNSSTTDTWNKAGMTNEEKTPDALKQIYRSLKTTQGFYYINIDEDLMQGAVITLRYSIVVANESEVDTLGMLTGYKTGEDIYNEVATIFETGNSKNEKYEYLNTKANNTLPTYGTDEKAITENIQGLKYGYFSGATYYTGTYHTDTYVVETRIDQIIDYVDNNLNVREEDNSTKDSSWRTVSLKELVEGDIQKDIVGQENDNNIYENNITLKYVPYEYAKQYTKEKQNNKEDEPKKVISVNNVGNMLADEVYRIKDLGTNNLGEIESRIPYAKANGEIKVDENGTIKDDNGNKNGNEMTIMDSIGREYITAQRNNILLSIPETDKNPDLYKYLIPAKALTAKPNMIDGTAVAIEIKVKDITDEEIDNENTSNEVKDAMKELRDNFKGRENSVMFPETLEGLKNYINAYMADENFNGDEKIYEIAEGKLLKLAQETIASELKQYVYGTQNGESKIYEDDKIKGYEKKNGDTSAKIRITATRTISPESTADERDDLTFENLAEILQFSNEAGRRDEFATVGDAQVWEGAWQASTGMTPQGGDPEVGSFGNEESGQYNKNNQTSNNEAKTVTRTKERYDTDTTEMVLLSPPTGLSQRELVELGTVKTQNNILLISVLTLTMTATIIIVIKISNRKKFYR